MLKNKNGFSLLELIIVIAIIAVLAAMAQPTGSRSGRGRSRQRACFSIQRVLQGAIEMYNMDVYTMIDTALPGGDFGDFETVLVREKYLKDYLEPPEEDCSYGFINITKDGSVFCKYHGTIDSSYESPIIPEYDKSLEKPFSYSYNENKIRIKREREYKKFLDISGQVVKSPPFLIFAVIFIIIFTLMIGGKNKKKDLSE
jgi:prepilin-type N-terminal cleavage/methylation domain-containing protein